MVSVKRALVEAAWLAAAGLMLAVPVLFLFLTDGRS